MRGGHGRRLPWAEIDADLRAGMRTRDVSKKYGTGESYIGKRRRELGLPAQRRGRRRGDVDSIARSPITEIIVEKLKDGRNAAEAAVEVGVSYSTAVRAKQRWIHGVTREYKPKPAVR